MDPEVGTMSPVPHRGLRFGVLLPFACALLGWAASRIGAHPSIRDARQQVVSAMARPTLAAEGIAASPMLDPVASDDSASRTGESSD